jgi:hypothetical protein
MKAASESRYAPMIQPTSAREASKSDWIAGRATVTDV